MSGTACYGGGVATPLDENVRKHEVMAAMVQRYAERVARDGELGKELLRMVVDGDVRMVKAAETEIIHQWAFMLGMPIERLRDAILARIEEL